MGIEKSLYKYYKELYESEAIGVWWKIKLKKPYELPYERLRDVSLLEEEKQNVWKNYVKAGWNKEHIKTNEIIIEESTLDIKPEHIMKGVLPEKFVETHVNTEGKVDYLVSYTKIDSPGDITEKNRYIINNERYNPEKYSYMGIGQDKMVEEKEIVSGVLDYDSVIRNFTTVDIGNYIIEKMFALVTIYVIIGGLQGYWFIVYRTIKKGINPNYEWTTIMRYKNWNIIEPRDMESIRLADYEEEQVKRVGIEEARQYCEYKSWIYWTSIHHNNDINVIKNINEGLNVFINIFI